MWLTLLLLLLLLLLPLLVLPVVKSGSSRNRLMALCVPFTAAPADMLRLCCVNSRKPSSPPMLEDLGDARLPSD